MKTLVLGVSGSVAAYRAADLARELMRAGYTVRVCLTDSAQKFVTPALFEALTGQPCLVDTFEEPTQGRMAHIDWARQGDILLIAPATANTLNKIAAGVGDDMLTTMALAYEGMIVVAPAMNPSMYAHETTQHSIQALQERGVVFVEPDEGDVACGEQGQGKLASIAKIVETTLSIAHVAKLLEGKKVLITSGPTQEPIDDVRYISNRSSGRMGAALAHAALLMGASVTVVSGPTSVSLPKGANVERVSTAVEMLEAAERYAPEADLIIGAAAVADYRLLAPTTGKMRRSDSGIKLELVPNPDVIASLAGKASAEARVVGFAAEPTADLSVAKDKLAKKKLYALAANDVSRSDIAFNSAYNEITLLFGDGTEMHSGRRSKLACALWMLEQIATSPS